VRLVEGGVHPGHLEVELLGSSAVGAIVLADSQPEPHPVVAAIQLLHLQPELLLLGLLHQEAEAQQVEAGNGRFGVLSVEPRVHIGAVPIKLSPAAQSQVVAALVEVVEQQFLEDVDAVAHLLLPKELLGLLEQEVVHEANLLLLLLELSEPPLVIWRLAVGPEMFLE
jgi:hypothetical protein